MVVNHPSQSLSAGTIAEGLQTEIVGCHVRYFQRIGSTNDEAMRLVLNGAPEGTLVVADEQMAGKGRMGRRWVAPQGTSLLFTIVFYPNLAISQMHRMTMVCSLALTEAIHGATSLPARIKWPNDIMIRGKKVGGLLTEAGVKGDRQLHCIVGIGLNVNLDPATLEQPLVPATSLSHELGHPVDRLSLLRLFLRTADVRYRMLRGGWSPQGDWSARLDTIGKRVRFYTRREVVEGLAESVDEEGAMLLRLDSGDIRRVLAGDVTSHPGTEAQQS